MRSVQRVVNEFDKDNQIVSPKKRNTPNPFPKVDGFDLDAIRRIVHDFYEANESPTLKKIHAAVKSQLRFPYGRENLRQNLIKIGFRYRKRGRERIFYERGDIVSWREKYLRRIKQVREQEPERDTVYLDEIWLTEGHQKNKVSVENKDNDDNQGDSGLGIEQDYHDEMDHEKYENYFETQICKNVSKSSALVIDNASYHSKYSEDHPK